MAKILVVDRNEAFATMLKEMLESEGHYTAEVAHRGSEALALLGRYPFDLTIVDMDLEPADMGYGELILSIRQAQPTMRLVIIPLSGDDLPPQARRLGIQGVLSKPFFADDLLPRIQEALSREVRVGPPQDGAAEHRLQPGADRAAQIQEVLAELSHETRADAVWLVSGNGGAGRVTSHAGTMNEKSTQALARLSSAAVRAAQAVAHILGQPNEPFVHHMFENDASRLYIMALPRNLLLVIVTPIHTPLGTIRHNLRRAWRHLDPLTLT